MTAPKQRKAIAVLNLAISVHDLIGRVKSITSAMTANAYFKTPSPPLATITADLAELEAAQTVALTRAKGTAAQRDAKLVIVRTDLHDLKGYVQTVANAEPANASAIIESAAMSIKKPNTRTKQDIAVQAGAVSGSVEVIVKAAAHRASYDWEHSTDRKTWTRLPMTLQARTIVPNLPLGATAYFRSRAVTRTGTSDWSQPISTIVK